LTNHALLLRYIYPFIIALQGKLTEKREQVITLTCNNNSNNKNTKGRAALRTHEVEVMLHHTLNEFVQMLPCPCNVSKPESESKEGDAPIIIDTTTTTKEKVTKKDDTAYWCIDGTLYVQDPTKPFCELIERAKAYACADKHASAVPMGNMMTTTFGSLDLPIGSKSYYHHDGGCVHELTVLDSKFVCPEDAVLRDKPVVSFVQSGMRRKCEVCLLKTAQYKCFHDKFADAECVIYCATCYHALQYTTKDQLKNTALKAYNFL
jgi:hypothetical protein